MEPVRLSLVVPLFNEEGNAVSLAKEIDAACADIAFEMIFVDDASTDNTLSALLEAKSTLPVLRVLRHKYNAGQSRAIRTGVLAARGKTIGILDGDGQNDPADLPALLNVFHTTAPSPGMVAGERMHRKDSLAKRLGSRLGNTIRQAILHDKINDAGCGLKVIARQTYLQLPYFDHQHRYMAALVIREGLTVITHPARHRPRTSGQSKYTNLGRFIVSLRDLLGMLWLQARMRNPGDIKEL